MTSVIFLLYAVAHLALFAWAMLLFLRHKHPATVPLLIVTFGLVYDNGVLAAGSMIGHGEVLEHLSVPRFFMHAFGTPLLILTALGFMRRTDAVWTRSGALAASLAVLTLLMVAIGVHADLLNLELTVKQTGDLISYGNAGKDGPPVAPIATILVLIGAGAAVWRRAGAVWMLLGAIAQFIAAAIGDMVVVAGNLGELALLAGLVVTDSHLSPPSGKLAVTEA